MSPLFARMIGVAALVLPLAGLGQTWLTTHREAQLGTEWDVPITGYDPGDYLRGHYVQFRYEWPVEQKKTDEFAPSFIFSEMCIVGAAPTVTRLIAPPDKRTITGTPCANYVHADEPGGYRPWGLESGRLYASETEAMRLQQGLSDPKQQGVVRVRLRPDGHLTPLRITFRPKPAQPAAESKPAR